MAGKNINCSQSIDDFKMRMRHLNITVFLVAPKKEKFKSLIDCMKTKGKTTCISDVFD